MAILHSSRPRRLWPALAAAAIAANFISLSVSAEIWVVTDRQHPVEAPAGSRVILLDQNSLLEHQLSQGLPANPQEAIAIVQQRLQGPNAKNLERDLSDAQQGVADAWSVGVSKVPAVVVDRQFVIYGESNVQAAIERIAQYRRGQP